MYWTKHNMGTENFRPHRVCFVAPVAYFEIWHGFFAVLKTAWAKASLFCLRLRVWYSWLPCLLRPLFRVFLGHSWQPSLGASLLFWVWWHSWRSLLVRLHCPKNSLWKFEWANTVLFRSGIISNRCENNNHSPQYGNIYENCWNFSFRGFSPVVENIFTWKREEIAWSKFSFLV